MKHLAVSTSLVILAGAWWAPVGLAAGGPLKYEDIEYTLDKLGKTAFSQKARTLNGRAVRWRGWVRANLSTAFYQSTEAVQNLEVSMHPENPQQPGPAKVSFFVPYAVYKKLKAGDVIAFSGVIEDVQAYGSGRPWLNIRLKDARVE